jgi:hypothetical protein
MDKTTYSEQNFIINLVISSCDNLSPILISQKIKQYFDEDVSIQDISAYIKGFKQHDVTKNEFTLKMSDIF